MGRGGEGIDHITCRICGRAFRAIKPSHLVFRHDFDPEHPILEYKERFGVDHSWSRETLEKTVASKIRTLEMQGRRWSRERVTREIHKIYRRTGDLDFASLSKADPVLPQAARWRFGSWRAAVASAGIDADRLGIRKSWRRKEVLEAVRKTGGDRGRAAPSLLRGVHKHFRTWTRAVAAAGLPLDRIRKFRFWTRKKVIDEIRRIGRSVSMSQAARLSRGIVLAARRIIGSWTRALKLAGFPPYEIPGRERWTREDLAEELRRIIGSGRAPPSNILRAARNLFGSWENALRTAGMPVDAYSLKRRWTREAILDELRRLGRPCPSMKAPSGLRKAAFEKFGSWRKTLEAAGYRYPERRWRQRY